MPLVSATLSISFTSNNLDGCHNVYYGTTDGGPYAVFNIVCSPPTGSCTAEIPITVDPESCSPVTYYGYVEACCNEAGELGQVAFPPVTFTPTPECIAVNFICTQPLGCSSTTTGANFCYTGGEINAKDFNTEFTLCYQGGSTGVNPGLFAQYTYADNPAVCCNTCVSVTTSGSGSYQYVDCNGVLQSATVAFPDSDTFCALLDSYSSNLGSSVSFTTGGNCIL